MLKYLISDMDGVIYRGKQLIPGAKEMVQRLLQYQIPFLFLTNNAEQTPLDLRLKLEGMGIEGLGDHNFITSAMATAMFLKAQSSAARVYVVGGGGLVNELYNAGFSMSEHDADYVVVSKTTALSFDQLKRAIRLIDQGAKFIGTNPDMVDPKEDGTEPAAGTILAAIEAATGRKPYIVGKPNALMMTLAKRKLQAHAEETLMIGDRMDTDIVGGMEAGMKTCLVLSGVTTPEMIDTFPYRPEIVLNSVADLDFSLFGH